MIANSVLIMELLAVNQPWNLILYMVIPVVLAEAMVATAFYTVSHRGANAGAWQTWNKWIGIALLELGSLEKVVRPMQK